MASNDSEVRGVETEASRNSLASAGRVRRDAAQNRDHLLAAARHLLGSVGRTVSARDLAREAGLSVATLYRHFPTRQDLISAVLDGQVLACDATVRRAVTDPDPARGVRSYLNDTFAAQAADVRFVAAYRRAMASPSAENVQRRVRFHRDLTALVGRAKRAGVVRADLTSTDLLLMVAANSGVTTARGEDATVRSRRLAEIVLAGIGLPTE
ncbi:MAG TPA: helix-turn-helix domain-containing protein [Pseudonocardiaceae bacterium]|jgi:AcrR family transcriptional regulator|nr:helix-turn-helix domain-containing protein [Pseudonocardiaceae bacterium]